MKLRTLSVLLALLAVAAFAVLNWSVILAPTPLSLGVIDIQAPLGLIFLALMGAVVAVFLVYVLYLQSTVMFDARAHAKELQSNRKLADQAEASRFTELRGFLDIEFKRLAVTDRETKLALEARLDQLERALRLAVDQSGNSLAAHLAEMDERSRPTGLTPR